MTLIISDQALWTIETRGLSSPGSVISKRLDLDVSVLGGATVNASTIGSCPFNVSVVNGTTSKPTINLTISSLPVIGQEYQININGDILTVKFAFSEDYNHLDWSNSTPEDNAGGGFKLQQITTGARLLSTSLNAKLKALLGFASLVNNRVDEVLTKYRIKKLLPDIVNSAIMTGTVPMDSIGTVHYAAGSSQIDSILISDSLADTSSHTLFTFNYTTITGGKSITKSGSSPVITDISVLDNISIDRVANDGITIKYNISKIQVNRITSSFTSAIDSSYSINMPRIVGWEVVG